jgi:hypothetical protein
LHYQTEVQNCQRKHFGVKNQLLTLQSAPINKPFQAVWAMKQKCIPGSGLILKYKARLNAYGGQEDEGVNYWDTYVPVVCWMSVRLMLGLTLAEKLHS